MEAERAAQAKAGAQLTGDRLDTSDIFAYDRLCGMRILLEILLIGLLAFVGWRQPFRDLVRTRFPQTELAPSRLAMRTIDAERQAVSARQEAVRGKWMYEQPGALERRGPAPGR